jgi:hypothetical protein
MEEVIKVLIVEDVSTDAELIMMELESSSLNFLSNRVETKSEFRHQLEFNTPHIILSDYSLPSFSALEALRIKGEINSDIPFILVTGNQTEEIAVDCIKKGADDYILKSSLTRLPSAVNNILEKKKAELANRRAIDEVKAREEKYRNLFENSLVGMFRASLTDCMFIEANEKARQILGVDVIIGMHFDDFNLCNEVGKLSQHLYPGVTSIENFELQFNRPDGSVVWISISSKIFPDEDMIEGVIHDITSLKNSYVEMEKANYELDRFAYHASHDLRSPLRSFEGLIQAALEEESIEDIQMCLKMMQKSVLKMDGLITDLLSIAHNKKAEAKIISIDFDYEVKECLSQLAFMENYTSIYIRPRVKQKSEFYSDAVRLRIILNNIISNAIKYHRVDQPTPTITIDINIESELSYIIVQDNGMGIGEKDLAKVFDMFYRASNESEGSGLGLYLVKSTVEKLNGSINVESTIGKGTTFKIVLPNMKVREVSAAKAIGSIAG